MHDIFALNIIALLNIKSPPDNADKRIIIAEIAI